MIGEDKPNPWGREAAFESNSRRNTGSSTRQDETFIHAQPAGADLDVPFSRENSSDEGSMHLVPGPELGPLWADAPGRTDVLIANQAAFDRAPTDASDDFAHLARPDWNQNQQAPSFTRCLLTDVDLGGVKEGGDSDFTEVRPRGRTGEDFENVGLPEPLVHNEGQRGLAGEVNDHYFAAQENSTDGLHGLSGGEVKRTASNESFHSDSFVFEEVGQAPPEALRDQPPAAQKSMLKQATSAAAVSGTAGLIVLHAPVVAAALAAGAAYATTRPDGTGKVARSVGDVGIAVAGKAKTFANQHNLPDKASHTLQKVKTIDRQLGVTSTAQNAAASSWQLLRDLEAKHHITQKVGQGVAQGAATAASVTTSAIGWIRK